ncbi:Fic family protein [Salegentibacter sp. JZCK2]|uniref:Fic family protein n=1 Tax=Salegentibacter tibetensis TaxID=2873600 RepID=UPI001CCD2E34|nr:Fic family protein [Salegentibacter tibetensis]MBZ9730385.1 Fic family protein [Salegentibacter tibetensis]
MIDLSKYTSGNFRGSGLGYKQFHPNLINEQWVWNDPQINKLLQEAAVKLGELNAYARLVPNVDLFIQLHVTKEAVTSSRIEGTQTGIDEALLPEDEIMPGRLQDWIEVQNYSKALNYALETLPTLPISSRLLRDTHKLLLDSVRGQEKQPGTFRNSQNWIGGTSISDAVFIPPQHQDVNNLMGDLEQFLHNTEIEVPELIRIAIAHYQFETIHPFLDGNGRIGRLLITLYLVGEQILDKPLLYLSSYFEKNKGLYYDNLMRVRTHSDMRQWLRYFLVGVRDTATQAVETLGKLIVYKQESELKIAETFGRRSASGHTLFQHLLRNPVITKIEQVQEICSLSYKASNDLVKKFEEEGLLKETTNQSRGRIFILQDYINIIRE